MSMSRAEQMQAFHDYARDAYLELLDMLQAEQDYVMQLARYRMEKGVDEFPAARMFTDPTFGHHVNTVEELADAVNYLIARRYQSERDIVE